MEYHYEEAYSITSQ